MRSHYFVALSLLLVVSLSVYQATAAETHSGFRAGPGDTSDSAATLYKKYAKSQPDKGMTKKEFESYLVDHLNPDPQTAKALAAFYYAKDSEYRKIMLSKIEEAWSVVLYGTGAPGSGLISRVAFGEFLKKYPPGSGLPAYTATPLPTSKSNLLKIFGNKVNPSNLHITI